MLNMFRMLIHPSSGACDLCVELPHGLHWSGSMCVGVTLWYGCGGVVSVCRLKQCFSLHKDTTLPQPYHNVTPTHIEPDQCNPYGSSTHKSQAPEDGSIMLSHFVLFLHMANFQDVSAAKLSTEHTSDFHILTKTRWPAWNTALHCTTYLLPPTNPKSFSLRLK